MHHTDLWIVEHMLSAAEEAAQRAELLDGTPKIIEFVMRP